MIPMISAFLAIIIACITVMTPESYTLVADDAVSIRRIPTLPFDVSNVVLTLRSQDEVEVVGCIDYKTDIAVKVSINSQGDEFGYVSEGRFRLRREPNPLRYLFTDFHRLVWSCRNFFSTRKF